MFSLINLFHPALPYLCLMIEFCAVTEKNTFETQKLFKVGIFLLK